MPTFNGTANDLWSVHHFTAIAAAIQFVQCIAQVFEMESQDYQDPAQPSGPIQDPTGEQHEEATAKESASWTLEETTALCEYLKNNASRANLNGFTFPDPVLAEAAKYVEERCGRAKGAPKDAKNAGTKYGTARNTWKAIKRYCRSTGCLYNPEQCGVFPKNPEELETWHRYMKSHDTPLLKHIDGKSWPPMKHLDAFLVDGAGPTGDFVHRGTVARSRGADLLTPASSAHASSAHASSPPASSASASSAPLSRSPSSSASTSPLILSFPRLSTIGVGDDNDDIDMDDVDHAHREVPPPDCDIPSPYGSFPILHHLQMSPTPGPAGPTPPLSIMPSASTTSNSQISRRSITSSGKRKYSAREDASYASSKRSSTSQSGRCAVASSMNNATSALNALTDQLRSSQGLSPQAAIKTAIEALGGPIGKQDKYTPTQSLFLRKLLSDDITGSKATALTSILDPKDRKEWVLLELFSAYGPQMREYEANRS